MLLGINRNKLYYKVLPDILFIYLIIIDCINGILQSYLFVELPIATIARGVILLFTIGFIFKLEYGIVKFLIVSILVLYLCSFMLWGILYEIDIYSEMYYFFKIIYLFSVVSYFMCCKNKFDLYYIIKMVSNYGFYISLVVVFGYFSGYGFNSYGDDFGYGTKGFFIAGNDLSITILISFCMSLLCFCKKHDIFNVFKIVVILFACFFVGTRSGWFGSIIVFVLCFLYLLFVRDNTLKISNRFRVYMLLAFTLVMVFVFTYVFEFIYSMDDYVLSRLSIEGISGARDSLIEASLNHIDNFDGISYFVGEGSSSLFYKVSRFILFDAKYRFVEADYYELIGSYGYLLGGFIVSFFLFFFLKSLFLFIREKSFFRLVLLISFSLCLGIGYLAGHVVTNTMLAPVFAVLIILLYTKDNKQWFVKK